ncbi:glycosyltransferase [Corallincola holothuriorum]|uniref:Glycosyltransferase n=1 Tax=Corallincola holothuriorum TaxID=2282215 RepID=A0A368N6M0_9GAMM|nr:glycosyltransferase [Corallincola holothuriorum]RCU45165.1 glycosyltransferase [Corallincola holothuriorum]
MHVMHLIDSGGLYGAEQVLLGLVRYCNQHDTKATIVSVGDTGVPEKALELAAKNAGLPLICLRMKNGLNLSGARKIIELAKSEQADLLHSHGYKFNILMGLIPTRWRLPCITTVHGYVHSPVGSRMWCYEWLDRKMLSRLEQVVFVSEQTLAHPRVKNLGLAHSQVIANGLDTSTRLTLDTELESGAIKDFVGATNKLIVAVGRLSREKGFDTLLKAFADVYRNDTGCRILIVGEGGKRAELESLIAEQGLKDVVMLPGFCKQVSLLLQQAKLFVMPSLTEGLPMALLEAMAVGVPIIASEVGAIPQVLDKGRCGKLVPAANVSELTKSMQLLLADSEEAALLGECGRERQQRHYSVDAMGTAYLRLYRNMVRGN